MDDSEFESLLDDYLEELPDPHQAMVGVQVVWERDDPSFGALHIWDEHGISEQEVEQVLFEIPPCVEAKRHPSIPGRTVFWGATRNDRWIFIVCEDWRGERVRFLRPITAFEPDEGVRYWESL